MLRQGSVSQVKERLFHREKSHIVIAMRHYPRYLKKELRDEFLCVLSPEKQLLKDLNQAREELGVHDAAFAKVDYERRFTVNDLGWLQLRRLAAMSREKDVYLICSCKMGNRCHREILLLAAARLFCCETGELFHDYADFITAFLPLLPAIKTRMEHAFNP